MHYVRSTSPKMERIWWNTLSILPDKILRLAFSHHIVLEYFQHPVHFDRVFSLVSRYTPGS